MMRRRWLGILLLGGLLGACSDGQTTPQPLSPPSPADARSGRPTMPPPPPPAPTATPQPSPATPRQLSPAGQAEVAFLDGMAAHHAGAVVMASEALTQATTPEVRQLAQAIQAAQAPEIIQLERWRAAWYPDVPPTDPLALMAMHMGAMSVPPGPESYDSRFLLAMISHHQGAVLMAEELTAVHPELAAFATTVIATQTAEIAQMEQWLTAWGVPLPDPNAMQGMNHGPPPISELVFLDALLHHHTGMLALASDAQQQSTRPELLARAQLLRTESTSATQQLQVWRAAWYPTAPPTDPALFAGIGMSEMAVPDGPQPYDARWLMTVISHHDELALVAEAAQPTVVHPELAAVANTIVETTPATVAELGGWLAQWRNAP